MGDLLRDDAYRTAAIPPASPWLGAAAPAAPLVTPVAEPLSVSEVVHRIEGKAAPAVDVARAPGDTVNLRWWVVQLRGPDGRWSTTLRWAGVSRLTLALPDGSPPSAAAIRAISRTGVASAPTLVALPGR